MCYDDDNKGQCVPYICMFLNLYFFIYLLFYKCSLYFTLNIHFTFNKKAHLNKTQNIISGTSLSGCRTKIPLIIVIINELGLQQ